MKPRGQRGFGYVEALVAVVLLAVVLVMIAALMRLVDLRREL